MSMIKQCIKNLSQYEVPQDASIVKLNQNESPIDIPQQLKDLVFEKLSDTSWNRYPDGSAEVLLRKIAHYTSFPHDGIMVANASNELIQTLIYATCDSGDTIVTITPGFSIYGRVAAVMNIRNIAVPLRGNFSFFSILSLQFCILRGFRDRRDFFWVKAWPQTRLTLTVEWDYL